jgi:hypothetical protein
LVKDRQGGFNQQKLQHALFVEVFDLAPTAESVAKIRKSSKPSTRKGREGRLSRSLKGGRFAVVKIGLADRIELELQGWHAICPKGAFQPKSMDNSTLLAVFDHPPTIKDSKKRTWKAIQYQDAQQKIGDAEILSLERATLFACQANRPRCESVMDCIKEVLIRLDENLYRGAQVETASTTPERVGPANHNRAGSIDWQTHCSNSTCRSAVHVKRSLGSEALSKSPATISISLSATCNWLQHLKKLVPENHPHSMHGSRRSKTLYRERYRI